MRCLISNVASDSCPCQTWWVTLVLHHPWHPTETEKTLETKNKIRHRNFDFRLLCFLARYIAILLCSLNCANVNAIRPLPLTPLPQSWPFECASWVLCQSRNPRREFRVYWVRLRPDVQSSVNGLVPWWFVNSSPCRDCFVVILGNTLYYSV